MRSSNLSICLNYSLWIFQGFSLFSYQCSFLLFVNSFDILSHRLLFVNNFFILFFAIVFFVLRQLCKFITIMFDCQELFYFYFSQPFRPQATLIVYHSCFYLSRTFFIFFFQKTYSSYLLLFLKPQLFVSELSNSMRFSKQLCQFII